MKPTVLLFMLVLFLSCTSTTPKMPAAIGWNDEDTYTVKVTDLNETKAIQSAKHKILKDIVDVRVRNNSKYTDIEKIRDEFDKPLKDGTVIKRIQEPDRLTIYFQIRDKGLKKKFQRQ